MNNNTDEPKRNRNQNISFFKNQKEPETEIIISGNTKKLYIISYYTLALFSTKVSNILMSIIIITSCSIRSGQLQNFIIESLIFLRNIRSNFLTARFITEKLRSQGKKLCPRIGKYWWMIENLLFMVIAKSILVTSQLGPVTLASIRLPLLVTNSSPLCLADFSISFKCWDLLNLPRFLLGSVILPSESDDILHITIMTHFKNSRADQNDPNGQFDPLRNFDFLVNGSKSRINLSPVDQNVPHMSPDQYIPIPYEHAKTV
ncbi:hypothetical protein AGLY_017122 [Aphis glycines]|uniref:Uncharacterized protein n=1 Tax=Aphis glycines TaxID=307491 RepID=A0A6G0SXP4_APHGL|nr:hypothetical protein AGLY_017122 [Aphis glycines]